MTQKTPISGYLRPLTKPDRPQAPAIDTSDLPDSRPGTKLGTLRDAIDRAKARRQQPKPQPTGLKS